MYSVEDRYTFENLQEWIENCRDSVDPDRAFVWALVGNKCDLPVEVDREAVKARGDSLLTSLNFYTSAKTGENVTSSLEAIIRELYAQNAGKTESKQKSSGTVKVQSTAQQQKKNCC